MEFIMPLLFIIIIVVFGPIIVNSEKTKATNNTTIECIETPNVCKDRYEYLKLGEKLKQVNFDKSSK